MIVALIKNDNGAKKDFIVFDYKPGADGRPGKVTGFTLTDNYARYISRMHDQKTTFRLCEDLIKTLKNINFNIEL